MGQKRFTNYQDPVNSFPLNERYNGIMPSGRYRGFDTILNIVGLGFSIGHTGTGATKTLIDESIVTNVGEWITNQGTAIHEDAQIDGMAIAANTGVNNQRIDILIGEHLHDVLVAGGLQANYSVIQGPNNGAIPAVTLANSQTILGFIYVPANAATAVGITYTPAQVPGLGNMQYALINGTNRFNGEQQFLQGANTSIGIETLNGTNRGVIKTFAGANAYKITDASNRVDFLASRPIGTIISLYFKNGATLYDNSANAADGAGAGYLALKIEGLSDNAPFLTLEANTLIMIQVIQQDDNILWKILSRSDAIGLIEQFILELTNHENRIAALEAGAGGFGKVQRTTLRMFSGDPSAYFDNSGAGINANDWQDWGLTNGQGNRPDYRQSFLAGLDPNAAGFQFGQNGGNNTYQLTQAQLPAINLVFNLWAYVTRHPGSGDVYTTITGIGSYVPSVGGQTSASIPLGGSGTFIDNKPKYYAVAIAIYCGAGSGGLLT